MIQPSLHRRREGSFANLPRVLGCVEGPGPGPTLICVGGLHGNEPAGVLALSRVFERLDSCRDALRGRCIGLVGNRKALAQNRRYLVEDLNRIWEGRRVATLEAAGPLQGEAEEMRDLHREIQAAVDTATGPVHFLDLHTTSGPGPGFATLDDALTNRELAQAVGVPVVLGLEEELVATMANYLIDRGLTGIGFEGGQHSDPATVDRSEAAIWATLEASGVLAPGALPEPAAARDRLARESSRYPSLLEVRYRHAIENGDGFRMENGFVGFQSIRAGQILAQGPGGAIPSPMDGLIFMPLYQDQGDDGFFVVRRVRPIWLRLSATLRRLRIERVLPWLPGVRRHPELRGGLLVDRRRARWLARQLFHLLGYRRQSRQGSIDVMCRRQDVA